MDWEGRASDHYSQHSFKEVILTRLNAYRDKQQTVAAVRELERIFLKDADWKIQVLFEHCNGWPEGRQQTAKANSRRIVICDDIRTPAFQEESASFPLPPESKKHRVTHYAAVVLHEFGHVLGKNGYLDEMVIDTLFVPDKDLVERQADWWVYQFLKGDFANE